MRSHPYLAILALSLTVGCKACTEDPPGTEPPPGDPVEIRIFHTGDEHGWLQPIEMTNMIYGGVANLMGWLVEEEGFDPERDLLLSGGDSWTGAALSHWFEGEPTVEAFNAMGYRASVVGNHEFEFGRDVLAQRVSEAEFPFLAANLSYRDTGEQVDFADPQVMLSARGVKVGVIGLAGTHTPSWAYPGYVDDLAFAPYADTLATEVPSAREAGAEVIVVLTHECEDELEVALEAEDLDVDVIFAAHCHLNGEGDVNGIPIVSSGSAWQWYSVTSITYDPAAEEVVEHNVKIEQVRYGASQPNPVTPDAELTELVEHWEQQAEGVLTREVGYTSDGIVKQSWEQANLVTDAWLWAVPTAEIAISNFSAFKDSIPVGIVTVEDFVYMLPYVDTIYEVEVTGAQIVSNLEQAVASSAPRTDAYPAVAGMRFSNDGGSLEAVLASGETLDPEATYRVLVNSYMYGGGGGYSFATEDPTPHDTLLHVRQPAIDWTASLETSADDPLENYLDSTPRD